MDPFQVRLRFVSTLHRVNASLPTIQKALSYIVEHGPSMHSELWECIIDQFRSGSINRRINLLFLIDSIFTDETLSSSIRSLFRPYLERDLYTLIDLAVPENRWDAVLNLAAVEKIVSTWKTRFILNRSPLDDISTMLEVRKAALYSLSPTQRSQTIPPPNDMQRRIEEDRERHKRLRERSWILPPTAFSHTTLFGTRPEQLDPTYLTRKQSASPREKKEDTDGERIWTTQDLDFSAMWEETSDFNDDDEEDLREGEKTFWANQIVPPLPEMQALQPAPTVAPTPVQAQPPSILPPRAPASMRFAQRSS
ncbi:hypothetical protein PHSY_002999 [Pseudozyma hubeiensis SY62]|uniref:CID domain-containing protein n=1 Tax=Pseudozyma hubeiensis (strain SY62) TaxID=1305764 RepID=R9P245_PSEHS|nr:hypothetical protein PHSY_002999 [Pseudozyma hubeiensis SY62]GAC95423.1 hypothetical protein PHSY_002999 [Pseudozyma hubeiensis SY62]